MSDIHAAPQAPLRQSSTSIDHIDQGSLERGVAGDYDFSIGAILHEAWERTSGAKRTILLASLIVVVLVAALTVLAIASQEEGQTTGWRFQLAQQIMTALVGAPITAGLYMIGIRRAVGAPIGAGMVFGQFGKVIALFVLQIVSTILIMLGFLLLFVPGIYLAVGYMLALPLVAEKGLGPWRALETSRKAVGKHWFKAAGLLFAIGGINLLGFLALGIGLLWTGPMSVIAYGIYYRTVFGVEPETALDASAQALA